jgi:hypothetical protein
MDYKGVRSPEGWRGDGTRPRYYESTLINEALLSGIGPIDDACAAHALMWIVAWAGIVGARKYAVTGM